MKPELAAPAETLERLFADRHSCRGFKPEPVPRPVIERILAMAGRTASWCNAQPWRVTIFSGAETDAFRAALSAHAVAGQPRPDIPFPREYRGVHGERRRECGYALYEAVGVARGDRAASARQAAENFQLFGAPHVALVTVDEALGPYGVLDCGAWVSSFMLAAESLGVATIAQASLAAHAEFVRAHLGVGDDGALVCGVSFGFEDPSHPANGFRTSRAPVEDMVTWRG